MPFYLLTDWTDLRTVRAPLIMICSSGACCQFPRANFALQRGAAQNYPLLHPYTIRQSNRGHGWGLSKPDTRTKSVLSELGKYCLDRVVWPTVLSAAIGSQISEIQDRSKEIFNHIWAWDTSIRVCGHVIGDWLSCWPFGQYMRTCWA